MQEKNIEFKELIYRKDFTREDLISKLNRNYNLTLPQIYDHDNNYIGTYEDFERYLNV
ncbi:MAG: hypothetical protein WD512_11235 [Candidatus Paceibacterota bacterium]